MDIKIELQMKLIELLLHINYLRSNIDPLSSWVAT
jgi:hypothetical protein